MAKGKRESTSNEERRGPRWKHQIGMQSGKGRQYSKGGKIAKKTK